MLVLIFFYVIFFYFIFILYFFCFILFLLLSSVMGLFSDLIYKPTNRPNSELKSGPTQQPNQAQLDWPFSRVHVGSTPMCMHTNPAEDLSAASRVLLFHVGPSMHAHVLSPMLERTKRDDHTHLLSTFPAPSSRPCTT